MRLVFQTLHKYRKIETNYHWLCYFRQALQLSNKLRFLEIQSQCPEPFVRNRDSLADTLQFPFLRGSLRN